MEDIIRPVIKATLEAMLFVSTQPVSLNKLVRKARYVAKKELERINEYQLKLALNEEAQEEKCEDDGVEDLDNGVIEICTEEEFENDNVEEIESEEQKPEEENNIILNADVSDNNDTIKLETETSDSTESDEANEEEEDDDDVMAQLMKKQEEFEQEITGAEIKALLLEIQEDFSGNYHGIELVTVAKGYQLRTKYEVSHYLKDDKLQSPSRFSPSSLETLSIIAYQQPVTRQKIEDIRGVDSGGVLKTLIDKGIVRLIGRSEEPGRPLIYGTSKKFLEIFGINQLKDLPNLHDYQSLQLSSLKEEAKEQSHEDKVSIDLSDLLDDEVSYLSSEEEAVLGDLDDSIKSLKKVEKEIVNMHFKEEKPQEEPVAENNEVNNESSEDNTAPLNDKGSGLDLS